MTCKPFDVVVVPFPFTDRATVKRRPAVVISDPTSFSAKVGHSVCAMITSARHSRWPLDTPVTDLRSAGLPAESIVRMKLFTLDNQLILRRAGALGVRDRQTVAEALRKLLKPIVSKRR